MFFKRRTPTQPTWLCLEARNRIRDFLEKHPELTIRNVVSTAKRIATGEMPEVVELTPTMEDLESGSRRLLTEVRQARLAA